MLVRIIKQPQFFAKRNQPLRRILKVLKPAYTGGTKTMKHTHKPMIHRYWYSYASKFSAPTYNLVGTFPSDYTSDIQPLKELHLGSVVSGFDATKGWWDAIDKGLLSTRTYTPNRARVRLLPKHKGTWRRPKIILNLLPRKPNNKSWARSRNRAFMLNFSNSKATPNSLLSKNYLFKKVKKKYPRTNNLGTRLRRTLNRPTARFNRNTKTNTKKLLPLRKFVKPRLMIAVRKPSFYKGFGSVVCDTNPNPLNSQLGVLGSTAYNLYGGHDTIIAQADLLTTNLIDTHVRYTETGGGTDNRIGLTTLLHFPTVAQKTKHPAGNLVGPRSLYTALNYQQINYKSLIKVLVLHTNHLTIPNQTETAYVKMTQHRGYKKFTQQFDSLCFLITKLGARLVTHGTRIKHVTQPGLRSRYGLNMSLRLSGFFLNQKTLKTRQKYLRFKYLFKKVYFSFLAPNQVKKTIMIQKKRIILSRLVLNIKRFVRPKNRFNYLYFNNIYKIATKLNRQNNSILRTDLVTSDLFKPAKEFLTTKPLTTQPNYRQTLEDVIDYGAFYNKGNDRTFRYGEVRVSRIKFKPGYQRIWRRVRTALKDNLRLRFIYQKQLTKYLTHFYTSSTQYSLSQAESTFSKTVIYSRLLPDVNTFQVFLKAQLLYINGTLAFDDSGYVSPGDVIQVTASVWYYVLYRWLFNWTNQRNKKFRRMVFRKGLASRYKVMKTRKQHSRYTPNWVFNSRYDISDVKAYLEVDYFSLSAVVLYDPYILDSHIPNDRVDVRTNIYRLYNWKYIN